METVTNRVALVVGGLAVTVCLAGHSWAGTPIPSDADSTTLAPLVICTAPWPPFVENVPSPQPLRPPASRPDPVALGFTRPSTAGEDGSATNGAATDGAGNQIAASRALPDLSSDAAGPPDAGMTLPPPPLTKVLGRVLAGQAPPPSLQAPSSHQPPSHQPPYHQTGDDTGSTPTDPTEPEAAAPSASAPDTDADGSDEDGLGTDAIVSDGVLDGLDEDNEDIAFSDGSDTGSDARVTAEEDTTDPSESPLARLDMPVARALMPQGHPGGPLTEVVVAACNAAGLACRISMLPWLKPAEVLKSSRCDAVFPIEPSDKNRPLMITSNPLVKSYLAFFTPNTKITAPEQFTDFIVLAQGPSQQALRVQQIVQHLHETRLVFGPNLTGLIARLGTLQPEDRVALLGNYNAVTRAMADVNGPVPALSVVPAGPQPLAVGFSRNRISASVVKTFNQGLQRIRETRELQEILDLAGLDAPH